jgi:acyl-CoA reductase-like NAD-dependent aldehyde dehydrogenase
MSVEVLTTISPTTNEPILTRNGLSTTDLEELPQVASKAFESWRQTPLTDRQIIVKKFLKLLGEKKDELAQELTVQMGRPIAYTGIEGGDPRQSSKQKDHLQLPSYDGHKAS